MAQKGNVGNLLVTLRAELGQLRTDVKDMEGTFRAGFARVQADAVSFGRNLASAFGIGLSVGAIVNYGKSLLALGGQLKDLSDQTGISGQTLSGIKTVLEQNGSS